MRTETVPKSDKDNLFDGWPSLFVHVVEGLKCFSKITPMEGFPRDQEKLRLRKCLSAYR
ncbi:predicted protein [Sclerotinia sclerotiorum 1980 UF-70]|uniref:Uncharacterized protein n=1 Tax=Sclerotinia sclerotiorum (strain ATCC 18683 / 1980 / Ss-1) TaxID=665079 RepID=A7EWN1_SCLS1|nr:predicted protein [Sclerotinia sclerotiorum 1980 UF-70]EDN93873.1 predicted protein [Sclerotinia sclerotiorum 1980 UF-70]